MLKRIELFDSSATFETAFSISYIELQLLLSESSIFLNSFSCSTNITTNHVMKKKNKEEPFKTPQVSDSCRVSFLGFVFPKL